MICPNACSRRTRPTSSGGCSDAALQKQPSSAASARMAKALGVTVAAIGTATPPARWPPMRRQRKGAAAEPSVWPWVSAGVIGLVVAGAVVGTRVRHAEPRPVDLRGHRLRRAGTGARACRRPNPPPWWQTAGPRGRSDPAQPRRPPPVIFATRSRSSIRRAKRCPRGASRRALGDLAPLPGQVPGRAASVRKRPRSRSRR